MSCHMSLPVIVRQLTLRFSTYAIVPNDARLWKPGEDADYSLGARDWEREGAFKSLLARPAWTLPHHPPGVLSHLVIQIIQDPTMQARPLGDDCCLFIHCGPAHETEVA
jgi:hypothetical protein